MARSLWFSEHWKKTKKNICKTQPWCLFPEITTLLPKIIHGRCCEQFLAGTYSSFDLLGWPAALASSVSLAGSWVFYPSARRYEIFRRFEHNKLGGHLAPLCSRETLTAPRPASPKPVSSHQNNLDGYAANGEMCFFEFRVNCLLNYVSPPEGE